MLAVAARYEPCDLAVPPVSSVGMAYTIWPHITELQRAFDGTGFANGICATCDRMTELFSIFPGWFYIMVAVGVLDALLQFSDYRQWRKERGEPKDANE